MRPKPIPSARHELTEGGLDALIEAEIRQYDRRPGEHTLLELAAAHKMPAEQMRSVMKRMVARGKVTRRKVGKVLYYHKTG